MTWTPDPSIIITAEQKADEALEQAWAALRAERDRRLAETDKQVLPFVERGEAAPPDLIAHRQALRDLPQVTEDPADVAWPELL